MNAFEQIWNDLTNRFRRKRVFTLDAEAYETLRLVAEREHRSPQEVAAQLFYQASRDQTVQSFVAGCWDQLSPRHKQIIAYVCRGDTTPQIAAQLHIARTTVKSHVDIAMRKFGVKSRVELRKLLEPWDLSTYL